MFSVYASAMQDLGRKFWPLADQPVQEVMARKLVRARMYLDRRGINATAIMSKFKYSSGPQVLK